MNGMTAMTSHTTGLRRRVLVLLLMIVGAGTALAQKRLVVADVETMLPVAGVNVQGKDQVSVSDSAGVFQVPEGSRSLLFSHVNYESRIVNMDEVAGDTVYIISKLLGLKEVVVFGKGKLDDRLEDLNKNLRRQIKEAQLLANDPNKPASLPLGLLAKLLPKKWRPGYKEAQRKKRHDDILRSY